MISVFLADGFEEIEALTVVDLLRRAGIETQTVSLESRLTVNGSHNIAVICDVMIDGISEGMGVILPGGLKGVENIKKNTRAEELIRKCNNGGKLIGAICAAPTVLEELGILKGRNAICYPDMKDKLISASVCDEKTVIDANIITSKSAGTALDFALEIIKYVKDEVSADNVKKAIYYNC